MSLWVHDPSHSVSPELVLNWVQNLCACADCPLHDLVHIVDVNKDSNRRAAIKLRRARGETRPFRFDHNHFTADGDRKSTRLNSSHSQISYAVFCLKKKRCQTGLLPTRPSRRSVAQPGQA